MHVLVFIRPFDETTGIAITTNVSGSYRLILTEIKKSRYSKAGLASDVAFKNTVDRESFHIHARFSGSRRSSYRHTSDTSSRGLDTTLDTVERNESPRLI
ncbi:uncharacterized protein FOMMEDRAFT_134588 [Fomitiporia mediterranea MF3/22]|uniref:uncharacterized protein n=1 Tax=Fomitiporia mediterranea (strain MF3/22) TaxID=694068 RepID=UPI0004408D7F|nr:uncharacterized protein FOMMEDRAFT_134588 [Fomitiporia mediterranea MF3/22]EJD01950.1 hypothetical protein FOMMEDRAFT_134588 [Fomitiporia mediterranea MF3/22]